MNKVTRMPTFEPTKEQRKWMEDERKKTGNSFAVIMKGLIQDKINRESK